MNHRQRFTPAFLFAFAGASTVAGATFPATINASLLDGTNGFIVHGAVAGDRSGSGVALCDVNGDGVADVVVGAPHAVGNNGSTGIVYVVFGGTGTGASGSIDLASVDAPNGIVIDAVGTLSRAGAVARAGDVNGDAEEDLIIGAPLFGSLDNGESYVVFGGPGVGGSGSIDLSTLDGSNGFAAHGNFWSHSGASVSGDGDFNGDGFADVLIGSPNYANYAGSADVIFGRPTVAPSGTIQLDSLPPGWELKLTASTAPEYDRAGISLSFAGDVNADGLDDLLIATERSKQAYVVFGAAGLSGDLDLSSLDGSDGFAIVSSYSIDSIAVGTAGDVNADGIDDIIVGAPGILGSGGAFVIFGGSGIGASGTFDVASVNGSNGFFLQGASPGEQCGTRVGGAGDLNDDGASDVVVGAAAQSYVVLGGPGVGSGGVVSLASLDGNDGFTLEGAGVEAIASVGDVNDDGADDLILGAPDAANEAGASYLIFGLPVCSADLDGTGTTDILDFGVLAASFGQSVAPGTQGDLNGDGVVDIYDFAILASDFGCTP